MGKSAAPASVAAEEEPEASSEAAAAAAAEKFAAKAEAAQESVEEVAAGAEAAQDKLENDVLVEKAKMNDLWSNIRTRLKQREENSSRKIRTSPEKQILVRLALHALLQLGVASLSSNLPELLLPVASKTGNFQKSHTFRRPSRMGDQMKRFPI